MGSTRCVLALSLCVGFGFASLGANNVSAQAEAPAEIQLDPLPTHWIAERPVGRGAGRVTSAMLEEPFAEGSRWLHYGGTYKNFRLRQLNRPRRCA